MRSCELCHSAVNSTFSSAMSLFISQSSCVVCGCARGVVRQKETCSHMRKRERGGERERNKKKESEKQQTHRTAQRIRRFLECGPMALDSGENLLHPCRRKRSHRGCRCLARAAPPSPHQETALAARSPTASCTPRATRCGLAEATGWPRRLGA